VFCAFGVTHVGYYSFDGSTGSALSPPRWWLASPDYSHLPQMKSPRFTYKVL